MIIASGVALVHSEHDSKKIPIQDERLPCLPFGFAVLRKSNFVNFFIMTRLLLESKWNLLEIDTIEAENRQLREAVFSQRRLKSILEQENNSSPPEKA